MANSQASQGVSQAGRGKNQRGRARALWRNKLVRLLLLKLAPVLIPVLIFLLVLGVVIGLLIAGSFIVMQNKDQQASSVNQCLDLGISEVANGGAPTVQISSGNLGDPVDTSKLQVSSPFGYRPGVGVGDFHDGVDFAGAGALGSPIFSVADGEVTRSGPASGYGNWITIKHNIDGQSVESLYGHMPASSITVQVGDKVKAGQKIAEVGNEGFSTGPHLHFGIYIPEWQGSSTAVDPMPWLENLRNHSTDGEVPPNNDNVEDNNDDKDPDVGESPNSDGATAQEEKDADPVDAETTRTGALNAPQQANVAAIISAAKADKDLDDEDKEKAAATIATQLAGIQSNFLSINNADDPNKVGIFGLAPFKEVTRQQLANPKTAATAFYKQLHDTYGDDTKWMTMDAGHVVADMYPNLGSLRDELRPWKNMATQSVEKLWDTDAAKASATPNARLTQNLDADPCQSAGGYFAGGTLDDGAVPEPFVKWIKLGAQECEAMSAPILASQIHLESGFQPHPPNSAGAAGYTQFIAETWAAYGYKVDDQGRKVGPPGAGDMNSIPDAVMAQARYNCANAETIQQAMNEGRVKGDLTALTLAAYLGGVGSVLAAGGMPNNSDGNMTQPEYAQHIIDNAAKFGTINSARGDRGDKQMRGVNTGGGSKLGKTIVEKASTQIGLDYIWGGGDKDGPTGGLDGQGSGFDCSGLVIYAIAQATDGKVVLPHNSAAQLSDSRTKPISMDELQPGDLLFYGPGGSQHVAIYAGTNDKGEKTMVEAPDFGQTVTIATVRDGAQAARLNA